MQDQQTQHHHDNAQFWIGLFLGGLIGAMLIVLMGTEKGRRLAKKLEEEGFDWWNDVKDKLDETGENIRETAENEVVKLEEKGEMLVKKGKELIDQGKELEEKVIEKAVVTKEDVAAAAIAKADETLAHIEALQERGRQSTAELRKRLFKNIPRKT